MAKKEKIPRQFKTTARRSKNEQFREDESRQGKKRAYRKPDAAQPSAPTTLRLNKYIANSGVCSRREADELIKKGLIKINGKVVTELGTIVKLEDRVEYNNTRLAPEKKVYLLLNKPKDAVTTAKDPEGRTTVMDIIKNACPQRVYPVGRLDRNTTGVLLFTNDGDLSKKLTHPSFKVKKIYHVFLDKPLTPEHYETLKSGIDLEDGFIKPDALNFVEMSDASQIGIEIHSGRNRVVRRMFEHLGYQVEKLDRVYFSGLTKKRLPRGKWRFLEESEVTRLKAGLLK